MMSEPIAMLQEDLIQRIENAWKVSSDHQLEATIASEGQAISTLFINEGNAHLEALSQNNLNDSQRLIHKLGTFEWPEGAKRFSILWRNILIELERAYVLHGEGQCSSEEIRVLAKAGKEKLQAAARHWLGDYEDRKRQLSQNSSEAEKQLYTWNLQHNPWPTYRKQLELLVEQIATLHSNSKERLAASKVLVS